jgi:hypothetical protein
MPAVCRNGSLTTQLIEQMESLVGPIPDFKNLELYVDVCGGEINEVILSADTDQPAVKPESSPSE